MGLPLRACGCACGDGRDLLLPLVRHARPRRRVAALEPEPPPAAQRPLFALLPGARPLLERRPGGRRPADGGDRRGRHRRGRVVLVGPGLGRGREAPARARRGAAPSRAACDPPRAVRRTLAGVDPARPQVPRGARRAGRLRVPPTRFRVGRLGGDAAPGSRVAAALRGDRARRLRGRRTLRRLLHVRLHQLQRRQVHPPLQPGPRRAPALRADCRSRLRRGSAPASRPCSVRDATA